MELANTAYVILGLLHERPRSGYDIKQAADHSTRHFWAISYGQIYPELKRLTDEGFVEVEDASTGSRPRNVYRITELGAAALADWASDPTLAACELRDEMLLKVFFSDAVSSDEKLDLLQAMRARHEAVAANLRGLEGHVAGVHKAGHHMHLEVMRYGIGLHTWCADWCRDLERRLGGAD